MFCRNREGKPNDTMTPATAEAAAAAATVERPLLPHQHDHQQDQQQQQLQSIIAKHDDGHQRPDKTPTSDHICRRE